MDLVSRFLELLTEEEAAAILHSNVSPMLRGELRVALGAARNRALARLNDEMRAESGGLYFMDKAHDPALDPKFAPCFHGKPHGVCSVCFPAVPS